MKKSICWLTLLLLLMPVMASAQPIWFNRDRENSLSLTWMKASFDGTDDFAFMTSIMYITGHAEIFDNFYVSADVPLTYSDFFNERNLAFGNPYLGVEYETPGKLAAVELGVRFPLALEDNDAVLTGLLTDWEHQEAFMPNAFSVEMTGDLRYEFGDGFSSRLLLSPSLMFDEISKGSLFAIDEYEAFLLYGLHGWYDTNNLRLGLGLTGRGIISEPDLNFNERTMHEIGVAVSGKLPRGIQPGVHVRVPVDDDLKYVLDYLIGIDLTVQMGRR